MSQRTSGRKHGRTRTRRSSRHQLTRTLSLESLESRCFLSITELVSLASNPDAESSIVAEQAAARTIPLTAASDTLFADSATQLRSTSLFATGQLSDVSNNWQTVTLPESYQSMVVVLTPNYGQESLPLVPRMRVTSGNSFEVRVDWTDGSTEAVAGIELHYLVVEEGVYTTAEHGVNMEAVTFTSTVTDYRGSWSGEAREYSNSYESPVVVGQVMSYQDSRFSSFWAHNGSRTEVPSSTSLSVGKHAGDDPETSRGEETIGYLVLEAGNHVIGSTRVLAGLGSDSVRGISNSPPYSYALDGLTSPSTAILSSAAMDGTDGGRPILYGLDPVTATGLNLAIDEDQAGDDERRHTTEQVAYLVFESVNQAPTALTLDNQSVAENTLGAVVGQLQVTDPNEGDTHTFTVSDSRFVVDNNLLKLTDATALDYETESFVNLTVTVYDSGSPPLSYIQSFNLSVDDLAEASLSGTVFNDVDGDGQQGSGETGLGDWTVYLDANGNGQLDSGENSTASDSNGLYTFNNLAAGDYRVAQVVPDGWEQTTPAISSLSRIINGTPTSDFPSVGTVGAWGSDFCSGTLISQTFVLTAAHCAESVGDTDGNFTLDGQTYTTEKVHMHPDWNDSVFGTDAANDIALYELNQAVSGTTPSPIFTGTPQVGDELKLVGFGAGGDGTTGHNGDYGTKRVGTTPIDQVTSTLIHWSFDDNSESNTAPGDSGGPAFLLVDGMHQVAGVTSGGDRYDAGIGDNSYDTRVDAYQDWINQLTEGESKPGAGYHQVTLAVGQTIAGLDFGNQQQSTGPTDDHANEPGPNATSLTLDTTGFGQAQGTLEVSGDRDVFAVALTTTGILKVNLSDSGSGLDSHLRIYDSQGNFVADNDDSGGNLDSSVTFIAAAETYYLQAGSYNDAGTGTYSLDINFTADETTEASLSGTVFNDVDGDGQQGSGETGLGDWTVYLDANGNGQLDSGENSTASDSNGLYTFNNLAAGDYRVAQVVPDGWEQTTPAISSLSRIINGTPTSDFPSVGTVGAWGSDFCSGTLISQTFVLTAAHCAESVGDTDGNFTLDGQTYTTEKVHMHPDWNDSVFGTDAANDIALYELNQAVSGTTPSPIFTGTPQVGDELKLVGFGAGGDGTTGHNGDYGTKRVGTTPIDQVTSTLIHWSFDDNSESNTAPGDSGGPAFLLVDGMHQVAGVTSGGDRYDAGIGDNSYDTRVDAYQDWINQLTEGESKPGAGYHQVTLAVGQTIAGLDFGNQQEGGNPNPNPETGYNIEVVFTDDTLTTSQQAVFTTAAQRWGEIIVGDIPAVEVSGVGLIDDLMIYASAPTIDGVGGILGQAAPTSFRDSWLPSSGFMEFDGQDLADMESEGVLLDLILHEMGHVIGIGTIWSEKGLLQDAGGNNPRFTGQAATQAYNEISGNTESSVPVANTGGPGTADAHWREGVFHNELMTGYLDMGDNLLSRVTAGSLADLGYTVNLEAADDYTLPSFSEPGEPMASSASGEELLSFSRLHPSLNVEVKQTLTDMPDGRKGQFQLVPLSILSSQSTSDHSGQPFTSSEKEPTCTVLNNIKRSATSDQHRDEPVDFLSLPPIRWNNDGEVDTAMKELFMDDDWKNLFWKGVI